MEERRANFRDWFTTLGVWLNAFGIYLILHFLVIGEPWKPF